MTPFFQFLTFLKEPLCQTDIGVAQEALLLFFIEIGVFVEIVKFVGLEEVGKEYLVEIVVVVDVGVSLLVQGLFGALT